MTSDAHAGLVGALLAEQHDEWIEGRRYLGLDVLAQVGSVACTLGGVLERRKRLVVANVAIAREFGWLVLVAGGHGRLIVHLICFLTDSVVEARGSTRDTSMS